MKDILLRGERFVPTKVVCIGMNFQDHTKEMGGASPPREPVLFLKPNSAIAHRPERVNVPRALGLLHHEIELCVLVGASGRDFSPEAAGRAALGYAAGLDFTLRERQAEAKKKGRPWALCKGFDSSCVLGGFRPAAETDLAHGLDMELSVNGERRQKGNTKDMVFQPADILAFASRFMSFEKGDVLMCGTPAGVGELKDGDRVRGSIEGLEPLELTIIR